MEREVFERGIIRKGNPYRLQQAMEKAAKGEAITVGFLGGSITQGSLSSKPETCYAYLVYEWWKKTFPKAAINYVNAGIGGTTSQFGASRLEQDLLQKNPDVCIVEFSVNDTNNEFFMETYEGVIRKILTAPQQPAVLLLHNVVYDSGNSAEEVHSKTGEYYSLPACSIRAGIYQEILKGKLERADVTPDMLHPNDCGHALLAEQVITLLEQLKKEAPAAFYELPAKPLTQNRYEVAGRLQNDKPCELNGFRKDITPQQSITEFFRNGWTATKTGESIRFELPCTCLAIQYRKTIQKPAPAAIAILDGNEANPILLDGEFQETWGDCLYCETILTDTTRKNHTLEIKLTRTTPNDKLPFYLISLLYA